jgi:putative transposase
MNLPQRKLQRLKDYDYSQNNAYFITICTQNRLPLFGKIENNNLILNKAGLMVLNKFEEISECYPHVITDKYIVMPNHVHAIIVIQKSGTAQGPFPTLSEYIKRFKSLTTTRYIENVKKGEFPPFDKKIWQKSYHDHIIRNELEYQKIWEYIDTNPLKWELDEYYI